MSRSPWPRPERSSSIEWSPTWMACFRASRIPKRRTLRWAWCPRRHPGSQSNALSTRYVFRSRDWGEGRIMEPVYGRKLLLPVLALAAGLLPAPSAARAGEEEVRVTLVAILATNRDRVVDAKLKEIAEEV